MSVVGVHGIVLEVPDLSEGRRFYTDAGLEVSDEGDRLCFRCPEQKREAVTLVEGPGPKRLHHLVLSADPASLSSTKTSVIKHGGDILVAPTGFSGDGLWVRDPHGMIIHLVESPPEIVTPVDATFQVNQPGSIVRKNRSAMQRKADVGPIYPRRLGHIMLFTPNTMRSVEFFEKALGMGLADRAEDVIAFMCSRHGSDHHVVAFAQGKGPGYHHASFQVSTPDEVGVAGERLVEKSGRGHWGFGRHTIGSNFFHYIQDPWGSWLEYYCDIDYVDDYDAWTPSVYGMEDSLHHWGPDVPSDFVHNYETDDSGYVVPREENGE